MSFLELGLEERDDPMYRYVSSPITMVYKKGNRPMDRTIINPIEKISRKIYAYTLPYIATHEGSVKVGETTREVQKRIYRSGILGLKTDILFDKQAQKVNGEWFSDKDLHRFLIVEQFRKTLDSWRKWMVLF